MRCVEGLRQVVCDVEMNGKNKKEENICCLGGHKKRSESVCVCLREDLVFFVFIFTPNSYTSSGKGGNLVSFAVRKDRVKVENGVNIYE